MRRTGPPSSCAEKTICQSENSSSQEHTRCCTPTFAVVRKQLGSGASCNAHRSVRAPSPGIRNSDIVRNFRDERESLFPEIASPIRLLESDQECPGQFAKRQAPWHSGQPDASEGILRASWLPPWTPLQPHPVRWWFFVFYRRTSYVLSSLRRYPPRGFKS